MRAITILLQKIDISIFDNTITIYPKGELFPSFNILLRQVTIENEVSVILTPIMYNLGEQQFVKRFVHNVDPDHHHFHQDNFEKERIHYHAQFDKKVDKEILNSLLDVFVACAIISKEEKEQCLNTYDVANTIPSEIEILPPIAKQTYGNLAFDNFLNGLKNAADNPAIIRQKIKEGHSELSAQKSAQNDYINTNIKQLSLDDLKKLLSTMFSVQNGNHPHSEYFAIVRKEQGQMHRLFGDGNTKTWRAIVHAVKAEIIKRVEAMPDLEVVNNKKAIPSKDYQEYNDLLGTHAGRKPWRWGNTSSAKNFYNLFQVKEEKSPPNEAAQVKRFTN